MKRVDITYDDTLIVEATDEYWDEKEKKWRPVDPRHTGLTVKKVREGMLALPRLRREVQED